MRWKRAEITHPLRDMGAPQGGEFVLCFPAFQAANRGSEGGAAIRRLRLLCGCRKHSHNITSTFSLPDLPVWRGRSVRGLAFPVPALRAPQRRVRVQGSELPLLTFQTSQSLGIHCLAFGTLPTEAALVAGGTAEQTICMVRSPILIESRTLMPQNIELGRRHRYVLYPHRQEHVWS